MKYKVYRISYTTYFILLALCAIAIPATATYSPTPGDLVKGSGAAVYYVLADGKRLAFPDESVYFSWYVDFNGVKIVSDEELAGLSLAGMATMRPGTKIIKLESNPKVYAVAHGGVLRWLTTEAMAQMIFGNNWAALVVTIPDAFLTSYKFSSDITSGGQYWWAKERDASPDIAVDLDPSKAPDFTPTADTHAEPPAPVETSPTVTVTDKNVLFVLWDPKRPADAAAPKDSLKRVVYGNAPSIADYYKTESNNKIRIVNAGILGWYAADKPPEHYWSDDELIHQGDGFKTGAAERTAEAMKKADVDFDFEKYDANGDKKLSVDELAVFVVIPQFNNPVDEIDNVYSSEDPATAPFTADGVSIAAVGKLYIGAPLGEAAQFGTITHCFARHIFGLTNISVGAFSLMSAPRTDLHLDPYNRIKLGWITPKVIPKVQEVSFQTLTAAEVDHPVIRIDRDQPGGPSVGSEYFLIENRQRGVYDNSLPDTGIAIWNVNGSSVSLRRLDASGDDAHALYRQGVDIQPTALELKWSDNARSGVRLLNVGYSEPVMTFTLEKKILTAQDLIPLPSPIR